MKVWLSQHWHALIRAFRQLIAAPVSSILSIVVFGVVLSLPAGIFLLLENLRDISGQTTESLQLSILLETEASQADIESVNARLEQIPTIEGFQFISKEIALQQLQQESELAEVMRNLEQNPLPDAFVVNLGHMTADEIERLRITMLDWPKIAHVLVDTDWARKLDAMLDLGKLVVIMMTGLFGATLIIVIFNTIRLQILTRRDEIELSRLIGATDSYIRRPFLYFGTIQGVTGAILAWLILAAGIYQLNESLLEVARLYATTLELDHLSWQDSLILLAFSGGMGWFGARWSVARHLSHIDDG
jgi:cell division transport system permease protein